jgi:adenylyltransferase/sulfurtransferase
MNDKQLERYSRQIMVSGVDVVGQEKLLDSTAVIIGIGGLGSISSMYLVSAGVGRVIIIDNDKVELSNLQRQIVHKTNNISLNKIDSAEITLNEINPEVIIETVFGIGEENADALILKADVVLDGTDNIKTRRLINRLCVKYKKPLVSASVIRMEGQISTFRGYNMNNPCYQCIYPKDSEGAGGCVENGVMGPVAGVMGSLQAVESIKVLLGIEDKSNYITMYDAKTFDFTKLKITKSGTCPICRDK